MSTFMKDKKKGDVYEDKVYVHLVKVASDSNWELKRVHEILGEDVYRFGDLLYPDFTIIKEDGSITLIDAKIKKGYPDGGIGLYVAIERKFYESYLELGEMTNADDVFVYMHCEKTKKDYRIDLRTTPFTEFVFNNEFNKNNELSRKYYCKDMEEIKLNV